MRRKERRLATILLRACMAAAPKEADCTTRRAERQTASVAHCSQAVQFSWHEGWASQRNNGGDPLAASHTPNSGVGGPATHAILTKRLTFHRRFRCLLRALTSYSYLKKQGA